MSEHDNGRRKMVLVLTDELRKAIRAWQAQTQAESGACFPAAAVVVVQLTEAIRAHGLDAPEVRASRHLHGLLATPEMARLWSSECYRRKYDRVDIQMPAETFRALIKLGKRTNTFPNAQQVVDLVLSRVGKPMPPQLARAGDPREERVKRNRAVAAPAVDYAERFLLLCAERAARDRWHRRGGAGSRPASTVDDHLGRAVYPPDGNAIASERRYNRPGPRAKQALDI